jgi:hypothetical protein
MIDDITGQGNAIEIDPVATVTSTSTGAGIDIRDYIGRMAVILTCGAKTAGTNPTITVKLQDSPDNSTFTDISGAAFTAVTTTASFQQIAIDCDKQERYIRAVGTVGGTDTPTFAYAVIGYGVKKTG